MPQLTFTRYVAALAVVAFHVASFHLAHGVAWPRDPRMFTFVTQWPVAVTFFFVLSGFVLTLAYPALDTGAARRAFWRARFARIYPVYLLALVLTIALQARDQSLSAAAIAGQALLLQAFVPAWVGTLNYPGWSLSAEACFYALFPWLIAWLASLRSLRVQMLAAVALWIVSQLAYMALLGLRADGRLSATAEIFVRFNPMLYVSSFVWGMATALLWRRAAGAIAARPWIGCFGGAATAVVALATIVVGLWVLPGLPQPAALPFVTDHGAFAPLFAVLIVALASDRSWLSRMLAWRPLVTLGEASYAVYILQVPAWLLFVWLVAPHLSNEPVSAFCLFAAMLTVSSVVVLYALEKPARAFLRGARTRPTNPAIMQT
ncbi:MAG: acyltransferase [Casimicrobiaceae bacterium]